MIDMVGDLANIATDTAGCIKTPLQFAALFVIALFGVLAFWIHTSSANNKRLVAAKESAEQERARARKVERDAQINEINNKINELRGDLVEHKDQDNEIFSRLRSIEQNSINRPEFTDLQKHVSNIDVMTNRIHAILEERGRGIV